MRCGRSVEIHGAGRTVRPACSSVAALGWDGEVSGAVSAPTETPAKLGLSRPPAGGPVPSCSVWRLERLCGHWCCNADAGQGETAARTGAGGRAVPCSAVLDRSQQVSRAWVPSLSQLPTLPFPYRKDVMTSFHRRSVPPLLAPLPPLRASKWSPRPCWVFCTSPVLPVSSCGCIVSQSRDVGRSW